MSMAYVRETYGVPAKRGRRVRITWPPGRPDLAVEGRITSASNYIHVRTDGAAFSRPFHPTWCIEYLDDEGDVIFRGPTERPEDDP